MTATLADVPFIFLYLSKTPGAKHLYRSKEMGHGQPNLPLPDEHLPTIERLIAALPGQAQSGPTGMLEFEGVRCRLSYQTMTDGSEWICARRIATTVPKLNELGFAPHMSNHLHGLGGRDGLILVSGASVQGKTTTASSLLIDYLTSYGGTAVVLESPIEYNLAGRHGDVGHCFQIEPSSNEDWADTLKRALSWAPDYVFAGQIRSPQMAELLLRAATTGHTIITTVDAGTPEDALIEVLYLGEQAMGPSVHSILAQGLTALLFQTLKEEGPFIKYLFTEENAPGDPIRTLIRENKVTMISTYIDRIAARLSNQAPPPPPLAHGHKPGMPGAHGALPPLPSKKS